MPTQIPFDWREDETSLIFVLSTPGVKAKNLSVAICDVYVKVNLPPALFEVDLLHEIDPEHPKTRCRVSPNKVTVTLQKRQAQIWDEFRATGAKADLRVRRQAALDALEQREAERLQKRKDFKEEMLKQGEHAQWRLDSQNRETIEKWEQEEKEKWEEEVYRSFDSATGDLLESERRADDLDNLDALADGEVQAPEEVEEASPQVVKPEEPIWTAEELADTEEYVPDVRDNPGKIGLRFTERPRPGVPVRDRGRKPAPFPKEAPKTELPPMLAGDEREEDENDPVWLKDKGDQLMVRGDYTGAYNAYTEALKLASNARCFANRALTSLYLGNFEQCLEDCNRSIQILDFRNKPRNGELHHSADPEDEKVRARVEIRMGVAFLWLGAFKKAEAHFEKALSTEGLDAEEIKQVRQDLERVQSAYSALKVKDQADQSLRQGDEEAVEKALELYGQADFATKQECAVVMANRCLAHLQTSQLQQCLEDASMALSALKRWPVARSIKKPKRPTRLDPPYLDDPTFVHPDKQNQGEREWLMKHNGGNAKELPGLPDEYEWIKDVAEKNENAWIAVKKRMSKVTFDAIKRATAELQDALYTRQPEVIRQQMEVAKDQNKVGEGPSSKAILQAEDYAKKLEDYAKEQEAQREHEEEELRQEAAELDLTEALVPSRAGRSQAGFASSHPLQRSRKRLFVKALRVRLAVAEARLAARQPPQEDRDLSRLTTAVEQVPVERSEEVEGPAAPAARTAPSAEVPTSAEDLSPARNFSLSAELWRLREALAKANGAKDKASDVEVQRLRRALDKSQQKLQHYEESNEGSLAGSMDFCPQALKSEILDAVRKEQEACKDRRSDARSGVETEPDTARTRVAHNDEPRPSKPEYAQGLQGTVIKVVKVPHTPSGHATSPSPMRPTSPLRKTRVIAMSPPTRVQLSPHPYRGRLTDTPGVSFREVPSSAAAMAAHAIAATAAMVGTPSRPLPTQSPPRPERHWPRASSVTKPTSPQVPHMASRSVATPAKRVTWTTPRVAPPPLVSNGVNGVTMSSPQAPPRSPWSVAPVVLPEAFSPQRVRIASPVVEIRSKVSPGVKETVRAI